MKIKVTERNPFGYSRYGYLWEILSKYSSKKHLDFGAYDGRIINQLVKDKVVTEAIGVDANKEIVSKNLPHLGDNVSLRHINTRPVVSLPFPDNSFDSISILDVLEHVYDQDSLLKEIIRVLKPSGIFIVTVPGKHAFSFLDLGNYKFIFPRLHKLYYKFSGKLSYYNEHFVECKNGLFGDIEVEKMWHQHFTPNELVGLIERSGCYNEEIDGAGFFDRIFSIISFFFGDSRIIQRCKKWDLKRFHQTHLFATFRKEA